MPGFPKILVNVYGAVTYCRVCEITEQEYSVSVPYHQYRKWCEGVPAEEAFPELTVDQVSFLVSNVTPAEFARRLETAATRPGNSGENRSSGEPFHRNFTPEHILHSMRLVEAAVAAGQTTIDACRTAGVSVRTYYRWKHQYGGLELAQARRMKELRKENTRLKRLVAELSLANHVLQEVVPSGHASSDQWLDAVARARDSFGIAGRQERSRTLSVVSAESGPQMLLPFK